MATCKIKNTNAGTTIEKAGLNIEPGFFQSDAFIESFGDWTKKGEIPYITGGRTNPDGSPYIHLNPSKTQGFYTDKNGNKIPLFNIEFASLPREDRGTISYAANDAVMYVLYTELGFSNKSFEESIGQTPLSKLYDKLVNEIIDYTPNLGEAVKRTLLEDKEDHLRLIQQRLRASGIKYTESKGSFEIGRIVTQIDDGSGNSLSTSADEDTIILDQDQKAVEITDEEDDGNYAVVKIASYEKVPSSSASAEIKLMLEFIADVNAKGQPKMNPFVPSIPLLMDSSTVFAVLLEHTSGIPALLEDPTMYASIDGNTKGKNVINQYLAKLRSLENKYTWMKELADELSNGDLQLQLQFVSAFQNAKNTILTTEVTTNGIYTTKDTSNTGKDSFFVLRDWTSSIADKLYGQGKDNKINQEAYKGLVSSVKQTITNYRNDTRNRNKDHSEHIDNLRNMITPLFKYLDISLDTEVVNNFLRNAGSKKGSKSHGVIAGDMINATNRLITAMGNFAGVSDEVKGRKFIANNLKKQVALANAYTEVYIPVADYMATVGAKRIYLYSAPTVLQRQIEELNEEVNTNPDFIDRLMTDVPSLSNSIWLNHFKNNPSALENLKVAMRGQLQEKNKSADGHDAGDIGKADYIKTEIFNALKMSGNNHNPSLATQIPADKNREYILNPGAFIATANNDEIYNLVFKGYIQDELFKMYEAHQQIQEALMEADGDIDKASNSLVMGYHLDRNGNIFDANGLYAGDAFKFGIFDSLNNSPIMESIMAVIKTGKASSEFVQQIKTKFKQPAFNQQLGEHVVKELSDIMDEHDAYLREYNIFYTKDENSPGYKSISKDIKEQYEKQYSTVTDIQKAIVRDYVVNAMIAKIEYAKLFTGTTQYYKHDADYIKRVPSTYIDGKPLITGITDGDLTYRMITFDTELITTSELSVSEDLDPSVQAYYKEVDRTDAQGWITPKRWEFIMRRTGKVNKANKTILDKMTRQWEAISRGENIKDADQLTFKEVKILSAQPLKGVYFKNDPLYGPRYVKYSQAVLIPSMVANQPKAKALLTYMTDNNIDEAAAISAVKVGSLKPFKIEDTFTMNNGKYDVSIDPSHIATLDNRNWRLQQDLPTKTVKDNKVGTQIQKIIVSGLRTMSTTEEIAPGFTGPQLADAIDESLGDLSDKGISNLLSKYDIGSDYKIKHLEKFYKPILDDMKNDGIPFLNMKRALEGEIPLPALPHIQEKVMSNFMSALKKSATNLLTKGGGMIQVSDHLLGQAEIRNNNGIKMLVKNFDRLRPPKVIQIKGRNIVMPGQIFIPHKLIAELVPDYKKMSISELNKILPSEVKRIIGYRIPTQSRASTDLLEVVGILPPEMGDSIITYGEITSKTGSDFDIDKMYFMMPELVNVNGKIQRYQDKALRTTVENKVEESNATPLIKLTKAINTEESRNNSIEATNELNKLYPKQDIVNIENGEVSIQIVPRDKQYNTIYDKTKVNFSVFEDYKVVNNKYRNTPLSKFRIEDGKLVADVSLSAYDDNRLTAIGTATITGKLAQEYLDAKEAQTQSRKEYEETGFKDINEAMRGPNALVSLKAGAIMDVLLQHYKNTQDKTTTQTKEDLINNSKIGDKFSLDFGEEGIYTGEVVDYYGEKGIRIEDDTIRFQPQFFRNAKVTPLQETTIKEYKPSIKQLRNNVFNLFEIALQAPALYQDLMTSIDNDTTEMMVGSILGKSEKLNVFTPKAAVETRFNLKAGQSGIGDMVNANNDHTRSQGKGIILENARGDWGNPMMDNATSEVLDLNNKGVREVFDDINNYRTQEGKNPLTEEEFAYRKIADVLSELTNAFVDIANKNSFITRANWGALMNSYGTMLIRNGVHPIKVFSVIKNPIITELIKRIASNEGIISNESSYKIRNKLMEEIEAEYVRLQGKATNKDAVPAADGFDLAQLDLNNIYKQAKSQKMETLQEVRDALVILRHYENTIKVTKRYANAITTAKVGEVGIKNTPGDYVSLVNRLSDVFNMDKDLGFEGLKKKYFDSDGTPTLVMKFHENTVGLFEKLLAVNKDVFGGLNEGNIEHMNAVVADSSTADFISSAYNINQILGSMNTYLLSQFDGLSKQYTKEEAEAIEDRFFELRKKNGYPLIKKILTTKLEDGTTGFYVNRVGQLSNANKNRLVENWYKILQSDKELGEYLIHQAFRQSGFQTKIGSFHELIPTEWFIESGIVEHVKNTPTIMPTSFFDQVASNKLGEAVYTTKTKFKGTGHSDLFFNDNPIGKFKNGFDKFPIYAKNTKGEMYKFLGIHVVKDTATKKTVSRGVYVKVESVPEGTIYFNNDHNEFNKTLGIESDDYYINEFENIKQNATRGKTKEAYFFKKNAADYIESHVKNVDLVGERAALLNVADNGGEINNSKTC